MEKISDSDFTPSELLCPVCGEKMEEHVFAEGVNLLCAGITAYSFREVS